MLLLICCSAGKCFALLRFFNLSHYSALTLTYFQNCALIGLTNEVNLNQVIWKRLQIKMGKHSRIVGMTFTFDNLYEESANERTCVLHSAIAKVKTEQIAVCMQNFFFSKFRRLLHRHKLMDLLEFDTWRHLMADVITPELSIPNFCRNPAEISRYTERHEHTYIYLFDQQHKYRIQFDT